MGDSPDDPAATPAPDHPSPTGSFAPGDGSMTRPHSPGGPGPADGIEPGRYPDVPGYTVEGELGRGGMGVVYKARQHGLDRTVALKMVLAGTHARSEDLIRFLAEAETAARLQHQGIAQIFGTGRAGGLPYFAMEYVPGGSLADRLAAGPLPAAEAARLARLLAEAVDYSHANGIIHRDLKPSNILLTTDGTPKITDFGLARRLASGEGLTRTGSVLGTPNYMPPEQARGDLKGVGPPGDVYAAGAVLYEMLTGRPPFRSDNPVTTLSLVLNAAPVRPRAVNPAVPRDLETVALKCLEKEPARRYPGAAALADDLRRFQEGRPIRARRAGAAERVHRWAKRNPAVASLLAAVLAVLAGGAAVSSVLAVRAADSARDARDAQQQAEKNAKEAREAKELADQRAATAREAERAARDAERDRTEQLWRTLIEQARAGRTSGRAGQRYNGLAALRQAAAIRPTLEIRNEAIACLALADVRQAPPAAPPPGRFGGAGNPGDRAPVVDRVSGRRAVTEGNDVVVSGPARPPVRLTHPSRVEATVWRPDGRLLAVGCADTGIHLWRFPEGERHTTLHGALAAPNQLAFSPSGRLLSSRDPSSVVRLWDPATGRPLVWVAAAAAGHIFGPTDQQLVRRLGETWWQVAPGDECRVLAHSLTGLRDGSGPLQRGWSARFDRAGRRLLTAGGAIAFWDPQTGAELDRVPEATGSHAAFLPDGGWVAARGRDVVRWPDAAPYEPAGPPLYTLHPDTPDRPHSPVADVTPDGRLLAVADSGANRVAVVPLTGAAAPVLLDHPKALAAAFSPNGDLVATAGSDGAAPARVWEVATGRKVFEDADPTVVRVAFTPDGRWLVTGSRAAYQFRRVGTWEAGRRIARSGGGDVGGVAFSPDGRLMACMPESVTLKLYDPATGEERATLTPPTPARATGLGFSPDGGKLVASTGTAVTYLWDLRLIRRQLREMGLDWDPPMP